MVFLCASGIISLVLSQKCFDFIYLDYESKITYGGDAYTGIQNAAAVTSLNVKKLADIVQYGFGSVLLVMGLALIALGITTQLKKQER